MDQLVTKLKQDYPYLSFSAGAAACWSPEKRQIYYSPDSDYQASAGLLHEVAHALLGHQSYDTDVDLLKKEVAAWQKAVEIAPNYGLRLNTEYIQDCLDTYRNWLHKRSSCPACHANGIQGTESYQCLTCGHQWRVSASRLARPYRRSHGI